MATLHTLRAALDFANEESMDTTTTLSLRRAEQTRLRQGLQSILVSTELLSASLGAVGVQGAERLTAREQCALVDGIQLLAEMLHGVCDAVEERS